MDIWAGLGKSIVDIIILAENVSIYKNRDIQAPASLWFDYL